MKSAPLADPGHRDAATPSFLIGRAGNQAGDMRETCRRIDNYGVPASSRIVETRRSAAVNATDAVFLRPLRSATMTFLINRPVTRP